MKKKILIFNIIFILFLLIGITANSAEQQITIDEQVLVDENGIKIKATKYGESFDLDSPYIALELINNTDYDLTISLNRTSVNGIMFQDASLYKTIAAQTTDKATINFMSFLLEDVGITTIGEVETSFKIIGEGKDAPNFETDIVKIRTSAYTNLVQSYDDSGEIIFDENGIRLIKKDLSITEFVTGQDFYIDNTSGKRIQIIATENKVNDTLIDSTITFPAIEVDKKANYTLSFMKDDLGPV